MSDDFNPDRELLERALWDAREGPGVLGVKRQLFIKLIEFYLAGTKEPLGSDAPCTCCMGALVGGDEHSPLCDTEKCNKCPTHVPRREVGDYLEDENGAPYPEEVQAVVRERNEAHNAMVRIWAAATSAHSDAVIVSQGPFTTGFLVENILGGIDKVVGDRDHWKQARQSVMEAYDVLKKQLNTALTSEKELLREVEWLTFYKREVYQCLGAGVDDVNEALRSAYVKEKGLGEVPEKLRKEYLDYEADHGRG